MNSSNYSNNYFVGGGGGPGMSSGGNVGGLGMVSSSSSSLLGMGLMPLQQQPAMGATSLYQQTSTLQGYEQSNLASLDSLGAATATTSMPLQPSTYQSLFGVVIPGRPCITEFEVIDSSKAICTIENPMIVPDLVFFLLPGTDNIPPGHGAIIYYSIAPFTNWVLLGSVSPEKPSGSFRTGWTTNEELVGHQYVQLGISLEPLETIYNLEIGDSGVEDRFDIAHKIAMDLFRFTNSFCESTQGGGMMLVPTSIFDKWMERFESKYRLDPNFMLKISASNHDA